MTCRSPREHSTEWGRRIGCVGCDKINCDTSCWCHKSNIPHETMTVPHLSMQLPLQPCAFDLNVSPRIRKRSLSTCNVTIVTAVENRTVRVRHPGPAASNTHDPCAVVHRAIKVAAKRMREKSAANRELQGGNRGLRTCERRARGARHQTCELRPSYCRRSATHRGILCNQTPGGRRNYKEVAEIRRCKRLSC